MFDHHNNKKKNLLVFQPNIGSYRLDLFNGLSEHFNTSIYVDYKSSDFEIYDSSLIENNLKVVTSQLTKSFKIGSRQFYKGYWKALKESNSDIVLVSEFGIDAIAALLYRKLHHKSYKVVSICDDSSHMLSDDADFSKFHKTMRAKVAPYLDEIILVEPDSRDWYQSKYGKGYFFPIISDENRVRINYANAMSLSLADVERYDLKNNFVFIYIGRLIELKNVELLINSFKRANLTNSKLIIVGEGELKEKLQQLASDCIDIIFTGRLTGDKLNAWYNIADVLVLPSKIEPFGAVTNEALIGGCKVLVSHNAGSRCLVRNGKNGYIFDPANPLDLQDKLELLRAEDIQSNHVKVKMRDSQMIYNFSREFSQLVSFLNDL